MNEATRILRAWLDTGAWLDKVIRWTEQENRDRGLHR
jgi:hypothetical protein